YIGITCNFTAYFNIVSDIALKLKQRFPNIKIVIGGYHATVYRQEIMQIYPWIDHVISGADENDFLKVLGMPEDKDHCFTKTIPDRSLIDSTNYQMHRKNFSFIVATRGCPRKCTFCTVASMHGNSFVLRNVDSVIAEMKYLYEQHNVRVFDFEDDNLSFNRSWFQELLERIVADFPKGDIQLYAMNGISVETLSSDLLQLMWRAGFRNLNVSLVTAQDAIKQKLNRPFTNEQFEVIVRDAVSLGYEVTAYLIIGLPEQTKLEIDETIDYLASMGVLTAPSFYYPPPGTTDFDWLVQEGRIDKDNWISFRSSVFPVETEHLMREDLVYYFQYIRLLNFSEEIKKKYHLSQLKLNNLEDITTLTFSEIDFHKASEEEIGIVQLKEYLMAGSIKRVFRK
ncbi:MAG: B12-binding domain-containing radical SAM protein, partial [Candidatus Riflemargulisbacteria bacterium]